MKRIDKRHHDELRKISVKRHYIKHATGSCLIEFGHTRVVCTAMAENTVPQFLKNTGKGWVSAEYGMLPGSTAQRMMRERNKLSGRTHEIQRLIGRALRNVVDTKNLGERTIWIDCDVIQADGGTRTASVVGGYIAMVDCLQKLQKDSQIRDICVRDYLGAISVGMLKGDCLLDLCYEEDCIADVDMNVVMRGNGEFIEVQGTGEHASFSQEELTKLLGTAKKGIHQIIDMEKEMFAGLF